MALDDTAQQAARGRPRRAGTDDAVLRTTLDLIAEGGVGAATIAAVSARTGVARASIYLRWPNRDALISAAVRRAIGRQPFALSGDLAVDFRRGAEQARAILSEPRFRGILPALVASLVAGPPDAITYDAMFPNRRGLAEEYRALAASTGYRDDIDPFLAVDMVIGGLLNRLLASGEPPSRGVARQTADAALAAVRADGREARGRSRSRPPRGHATTAELTTMPSPQK